VIHGQIKIFYSSMIQATLEPGGTTQEVHGVLMRSSRHTAEAQCTHRAADREHAGFTPVAYCGVWRAGALR
jgi:hypothetical protein